MKNNASLAQAAALIESAKKLQQELGGVKIETTVEDSILGRYERTVINVARELGTSGYQNWAQIIISVRRPSKELLGSSRRASATVTTLHSFDHSNNRAGLHDARFALNDHRNELTKPNSLYRVAPVAA